MKNKNQYVVLLILFLPLSFLAGETGFPAIADTIFIASEPDYPPYCLVDENGEAAGFSMDLFMAAAEAVGLKVNIKIGIWSQIKKELEDGRIDALPLVGRTPEREEFFDFTMPYLSLHGAVFVRKGTKDIETLEDLQNRKIAVMKGDNAEEFVRRENISNFITATNTFEEAFKELAKGHQDAVITQRVMGIELLKRLDIKNIVPLDFQIPRFRQDFCFAVHKGDHHLLNKLNEGLSIIIANDTYEKIRYQWFGPDISMKVRLADVLNYLLGIIIPLLIVLAIVAVIILRGEVKRRTIELRKEVHYRSEIAADLFSLQKDKR